MSDESSPVPSIDQLDEQLVAYLDGELEPQAARQIENLLATDLHARQRLNQLASSWDLLDQLPRATVDDLFTRTTVEMVALAAEDEVAKAIAADPARRKRRWLEIGIAVLAAAIVGFVIVAITLPNQNTALLRDLPVIKNLELYRDVGDIELLKQLQKANLFTGDTSAASSAKPADNGGHSAVATEISSVIPQSLDERHAWVESLDPAQKLALRDEFEKFSAMPVNQQQALRQLDEQLSADKDAAQLRHIMQRYYDWLKTLTSIDRAPVVDESASPQDRVKAINNLRQHEVQQAFANFDPGLMTFKDRDNYEVLHWMRDFADNHESELSPPSTDPKRPPDSQKSDDRRHRKIVALAWQEWWGPMATRAPPVTETDIHSLRALLSTEKQKQLDAEADLPNQVQLIRQWIQRAGELTVQNFGRGRNWPNPGQLRQLEDQLSPEEKQELKGLTDPDRMRKLREFWQKHSAADAQRQITPPAKAASDPQPADTSKSDDRDKPTD